jgi:hypothetical protein
VQGRARPTARAQEITAEIVDYSIFPNGVINDFQLMLARTAPFTSRQVILLPNSGEEP